MRRPDATSKQRPLRGWERWRFSMRTDSSSEWPPAASPSPRRGALLSPRPVSARSAATYVHLVPPLSPSPPAEKAAARQDQAGQSGTDNGTGDGHAGERKARVKWSLMGDVGADPLPVGLQVLISYPGLKIAGEERWPCCRQQ